jgi:hypothetical protein
MTPFSNHVTPCCELLSKVYRLLAAVCAVRIHKSGFGPIAARAARTRSHRQASTQL